MAIKSSLSVNFIPFQEKSKYVKCRIGNGTIRKYFYNAMQSKY